MRAIQYLFCLSWLLVSAAMAPEPAQEALPAEMRPYIDARTVVDCSTQEVLKAYPALKGLEFAEQQEGLAPLLQKVGETVQALFENLPKTTSLERVTQERTEPGQTEQLYRRQDFYYLVSPQTHIADIGFEEYRTDLKHEELKPEELQGPFLLTSGYATHPIYFHPTQQPGSRFRYLGRQKSERNAYVVAFAQRPESTGTRGYLSVGGQTIVILLQGIAWIDPDTYQIIRMQSELLAPRKDAGLELQTATIRFGEVKFKGIPQSAWLPAEVVVTIRYQGYLFRNRHRYSQYRLFTVESQEGPKVPIRP